MGEKLCGGYDGRLSLLYRRRSVRKFRPGVPIPRELLVRCIEAATRAPSASRRQDWLFSVIDNDAGLELLGAALRERVSGMAECGSVGHSGVLEAVAEGYAGIIGGLTWDTAATAILVSCKAPPAFLSTGKPPEEMMLPLVTAGSFASAAMAAQNLMLAAAALGLGSCCFTSPLAFPEVVASHFGLRSRRIPVCLLALGWPDEIPIESPRKGVGKVVHYVMDGKSGD